MSFYFVYYECYKRTWYPDRYVDPVRMMCQELTNVHPIQFQIDFNEKYSKPFDTSDGGSTSEHCTIITWQKVTKKEYEKFKDYIG